MHLQREADEDAGALRSGVLDGVAATRCHPGHLEITRGRYEFMGAPLQILSHYPAWPFPYEVPVVLEDEHPCVYLPGRTTEMRWFMAGHLGSVVYRDFMNSGFRRSGRIVYQPTCRGCRKCLPIRVDVAHFQPSKSQRRRWRSNQDLRVEVGPPVVTDQKYDLYRRYQQQWHGAGANDDTREGFERFLYDSPVESVEFIYRARFDQILAVGICDVSDDFLSSVYFYFDPSHARRGLGAFGALHEIDYCRKRNTPHYYLGYWVEGCSSMEYKATYRPCQVLCTDGLWRDFDSRHSDRPDGMH